MPNLYTFQAGPDSEPYTVETPWDKASVILAYASLAKIHPWLAKNGIEGFNAQLLMLVTAPHLDNCVIDPMDGSGLTITGAKIREHLDSCEALLARSREEPSYVLWRN